MVTKASGELEAFDMQKLERSLVNAGADEAAVAQVRKSMHRWLKNGTSTHKIYAHAHAQLRKIQMRAALRYRLKTAIMQLGPTGYPFEAFIGQLYEKAGYSTQVGIVVQGTHVTHEMDVIATNSHKQYLLECKYAKSKGKQVSVQVPLYVRARVDDIISVRKDLAEYKQIDFIGGVVTNTRFTDDSIKYGTGAGLRLLAWDYPRGNGLKDIIEREKLYPITLLHQLQEHEIATLLQKGIVTCSQLMSNQGALAEFKPGKRRLTALLNELSEIA